MNELALFAGAGGGILGGVLLGWKTVCAVEIDAYAAGVLCQRQNDGLLSPFPIWDDVRTFDGKPWAGIVDVVSGGFPCTEISCAGKGAGITGNGSGLWFEMLRIVGEVRPPFAYVENSPMLTVRGLEQVCGGLAELGYNAEWGIVSAANVGAPHLRKRIWIFCWHTYSQDEYSEREIQRRKNTITGGGRPTPDAKSTGWERMHPARRLCPDGFPSEFGWWKAEPRLDRVADGVAARVDRLKALGNGQVPAVAAKAWKILSQRTLEMEADNG